MCGIAGRFEPHAKGQVTCESIARMCEVLRHRGPDDEGIYLEPGFGMGMRRLSIIDLQTGKQPIRNEDGSVWTVYNGEIYNFGELRAQLERRGHTFYTQTDTEVIVHLYEDYGEAFVTHLTGMFAIALWDTRQQTLILARDRLGIKPLYYAGGPDQVLFASEIKAILQAGVERQIELQALHDYLSLNYIPGPRGWVSTINVILYIGGVQLLMLGVIGKYLSCVYDEVRRRPLYLVRSRTGWGGHDAAEPHDEFAHPVETAHTGQPERSPWP